MVTYSCYRLMWTRGGPWVLTCTSWWGIEKRSVSACVGNTDSPCEGETCFKWENPDLEASKKHDPGPKSWKTWACKFQKKTTQRCCSHEDSNVEMKHLNGLLIVPMVKRKVSIYVLENESEKSSWLNESCWFWTGGVSFLLVKLERKYCIYRWNS